LGVFLAVIFFLLFSISRPILLEETLPQKKRTSNKGLYITSYVAQSPAFLNHILSEAKKSKLDTIVVDAKRFLEDDLLLAIKEKKLNPQTRATSNKWFAKLVKRLHHQGFIVVARLVVFKDDHLVIARPDLGVKKGRGEGGLYRDLKGGKWADPYSAEVRLYNALIAEKAALCGVDEVQFDYIRFPAERGARQAVYPFHQEGVSKVEAINAFLKEAKERLDKYQTSIAVDIFGVTAWQSKNDIEMLGQDLKKMAPYIDVLCPMLYPSHFHAGYDGFDNPGSYPYYFLYTGLWKMQQMLSGESVAIVPWLQGFNLRSPNFGPTYILDQIKACQDGQAAGFLVWNARNRYEVAFDALRQERN
ncbi:MAG: putative glycoside hydrolase, partial [bacterium]